MRLHETARGRGDAILWERHEWAPQAFAAGTIDAIPAAWQFSAPRIDEVFDTIRVEEIEQKAGLPLTEVPPD